MEAVLLTEEIDAMVARCGRGRDAVIPLLQAVQHQYHYLPEAALRRICETTKIAPADIQSVATFFPQFRFRPAGKHTICVCDGTACHLKGSETVYEAVAKDLGLAGDEDTDKDGTFTLQKVRCLGCCTLAPAVQIDGVTYGHVKPETVPDMLEDFLARAAQEAHSGAAKAVDAGVDAPEIRIGLGSCCVAGGSELVRRALEETLDTYGIGVHIKAVSCVGMCHQTPLMEVVMPGSPPKTYAKVRPEDVPAIVLAHFPPKSALPRMRAKAVRWLERLYSDDAAPQVALDPKEPAVAGFLDVQQRIATECCGEIDPTDLAEYVRHDGFKALQRCLAGLGDTPESPLLGPAAEAGAPLMPVAVIEEIHNSGLRGRGGAGFPTARKWQTVREAPGAAKYIICNGDEGDPGAFMDRMILESYTYRIIEGMLIASIATGALRGIFYIRAEYPLAVERIRAAIAKCSEAGILGDSVLGTRHAFHAEVREGAGGFVCGEETALIASLEGRRPTPRFRPPFPAHEGLYCCPTLVNNVETLAMVPWIIRHGADAFAALGTAHSKGTKVFALAGKIRRGGLIEVPMGMTVGQIVNDVGGGVPEGRTLKAVQVGGPSGGCIPAHLADLHVNYEALAGAGSMMGSGGFVVMDDTDCMVEMTRYFLSFTQLESCGRCTPCRVGTKQLLDILTRLCGGKGKLEDLEELHRLAGAVKKQSLCGLGRTAPNPVLTGLMHFRAEFEAHAAGRCPAHRCKALITYTITDQCIGCTKCAQICPADAIPMTPYEVHGIDQEKCTRCNACYEICPVNAVKVD